MNIKHVYNSKFSHSSSLSLPLRFFLLLLLLLCSVLFFLSLSLWIGTGVMGMSMCGHILKADYTLTVFNPTLSKAQPLIHLGAHLVDSSRIVAFQSAVVFSIVGYPSDVRSVVLDPTTDTLSGLCPRCVLVDMTTKTSPRLTCPSLAEET